MRSPVVRRSTHEAALQTGAEEAARIAVDARDQESEEALREANQAELLELGSQVGVLLGLGVGAGGERIDIEAARRQFRAPIERVETAARGTFGAIAKQVGLQSRSARVRNHRWSSYYNFHPIHNENVTKPVPIADTAEGTLGVELGTVWDLCVGSMKNPGFRRKPYSQTAFFAHVLNMRDGATEPERIGSLKLGRAFSADEVRADDMGNKTAVHSTHPGEVVLGGRTAREGQTVSETDYLGESDPAIRAAALVKVEQAAAAFMVLAECVADRAGVEAHPIDADAISLAVQVSRATS